MKVLDHRTRPPRYASEPSTSSEAEELMMTADQVDAEKLWELSETAVNQKFVI